VLYEAEEDRKSENVLHMLISEFVYICLLTALTQVRLQKFVVTMCSIGKNYSSVSFVRLQKFVVSALKTTKVCSVRF
jgi:hypothetical protein